MLEQQEPRDRGPVSRAATATALMVFVALGVATVWWATADVAGQDAGTGTGRVAFPREDGVGACLHISDPRTSDPEPQIEALEREAGAHDHLFPAPETVTVPPLPLDQGAIAALWPNGAPSADEAAVAASRDDPACAAAPSGWALRVTRELLADGADRLLERAEFGDDWTASVDVSFSSRQGRVRTKLTFSGPFGVTGSCWIDETFAIDLETGLPSVASKSQNDAGLVGLVACHRFEDELADGGGPGAQALSLLPSGLTDAAADPTLTVARIDVTDEMITLSGTTR